VFAHEDELLDDSLEDELLLDDAGGGAALELELLEEEGESLLDELELDDSLADELDDDELLLLVEDW